MTAAGSSKLVVHNGGCELSLTDLGVRATVRPGDVPHPAPIAETPQLVALHALAIKVNLSLDQAFSLVLERAIVLSLAASIGHSHDSAKTLLNELARAERIRRASPGMAAYLQSLNTVHLSNHCAASHALPAYVLVPGRLLPHIETMKEIPGPELADVTEAVHWERASCASGYTMTSWGLLGLLRHLASPSVPATRIEDRLPHP